jgi:transcription antitermination factor NusG
MNAGISEDFAQSANDRSIQNSWFALGVTARHEKVVSRLLSNKGYETFLPIRTQQHEYAGRRRAFDLPLFPGYLFCRFDPTVRLPILTTPGVLQVVGAGRIPVPVSESEIVSLRKAAEARISMNPVPYWRAGQKGRIISGPLTGVEGIITDAKQPVRLILSVTLLQRSVLLEVDAECVTLS